MLINSINTVKYRDMRHEKHPTMAYVLAIGYLIAAYFFSSWAFRMVPHKHIDAKAMLDIFVCVYLFVIGALLLISSVGISLDKIYGRKFLDVAFWFGLIALLFGVITGATIVLNNLLIGILQIGSVLGIFYLPLVILYLRQHKTS